MATGYTGTSWDLVVRNAQIGRTLIDDSIDDATLTYALTHNGTAFDTGTLAWEVFGYDNCWVDRFNLPSTPGTMIAVVTITATIDDVSVIGELQASMVVT